MAKWLHPRYKEISTDGPSGRSYEAIHGTEELARIKRVYWKWALGELGGGGGLETPTENLKGVCLLAANETRKKTGIQSHLR
ncbi:hypothetical protein OUZ56_005255 [Daphnia magna]|uniref:Uncharacterized protein n=1 Tax=Daphnia magna TaxID=35525 RepID=A0ABQ9YS98_9CRUS|nr:hypothetical protein OUZ56_005255 [Daphnia magna]